MTEPAVIDGSVVEEHEHGQHDPPEPRHEIIPAPALAVTPTVKATELVERLSVIREAAEKAMQRDVDFGVIPGTDKPTLYKPGAEKLGVLFQLDIQLANEKTWGPGDHLTVVSRATVYHAPSSARLGFGEGICSTRERKYAYRRQERTCPSCGAAAVIKGKAEYGGGWLCWKKRDGCGAKFAEGAPEIERQEVGEIDNPDLPDLWNTVVKMAEKRARIDAVLAVTGASALFTQDMDDEAEPASDAAPAAAAPTAQHEPSPAPEEAPCTPEQYQDVLREFAAAQDHGLKLDAFLERLDALNAPAREKIGERVTALPTTVAEGLLKWLRSWAKPPARGGG
jgi:hypothetical protein